jgi:signal transduction histidine kinase
MTTYGRDQAGLQARYALFTDLPEFVILRHVSGRCRPRTRKPARDLEGTMDMMSDDVLLEELKKRFLDTKKALYDLTKMNEKIENLNVKLTESERTKSDFLSNIRNEINNPLTSILGLSREIASTRKDEQTKQLMAKSIYDEAFELDFQLRNIFIAAELEAGETQLNISRVDVAALIKNLIGAFDHKARKKNLTMTFDCCGARQEGQGLLFETDAEKLHCVLANLLANAVEYNNAGKTVRIETRKENDALRVSIADEGIGIPMQERARLFERFRQLDRGSSKKHRGHGLGLSITKALVEMLGGKVSVSDAAGGGCVFHVVVPEATGAGDGIFSEDGNEFLFENEKRF